MRQSKNMKLGYVLAKERGETDRLLARLAERCLARGLRLAGVVQTNTACSDSYLCDMDVKVLPEGPVFRISQSLGPEARGCRLDPEALEAAVGAVSKTLSPRPDLLIVNKFGKHEADGRGFRDIIAQCLIDGVPVIAGTNSLNLPAFQSFTDDLAEAVTPQDDALLAWVEAVIAEKNRAA
jgi:nucleoside-triphosphatase THEP1